MELRTCDICNEWTNYEDGAWDEGDMWWCFKCIDKWESENKQHWADGQPKKNKPE